MKQMRWTEQSNVVRLRIKDSLSLNVLEPIHSQPITLPGFIKLKKKNQNAQKVWNWTFISFCDIYQTLIKHA